MPRTVVWAPEQTLATLQKLHPAHLAQGIGGGLRLTLHGTRIDTLHPEAARARYGTALPPFDGSPQRVALILRAGSRDRAERAPGLGSIASIRSEGAGLIIPASQAWELALVQAFD